MTRFVTRFSGYLLLAGLVLFFLAAVLDGGRSGWSEGFAVVAVIGGFVVVGLGIAGMLPSDLISTPVSC
jgi:hypothetical protein